MKEHADHPHKCLCMVDIESVNPQGVSVGEEYSHHYVRTLQPQRRYKDTTPEERKQTLDSIPAGVCAAVRIAWCTVRLRWLNKDPRRQLYQSGVPLTTYNLSPAVRRRRGGYKIVGTVKTKFGEEMTIQVVRILDSSVAALETAKYLIVCVVSCA